MARIPILNCAHKWECPNCEVKQVTYNSEPHTRFHACKGLKGLTAPMVPEGTRCKVEAVEREDYVGGATATHDGEGRAVMAVEVTRDDGNDVAAFADCASVRLEMN